ncbi:MAG: maleylpyruvate isomerase family mycothiol-dependent enzyme [Candidatus Dormiibacterota bacterium]
MSGNQWPLIRAERAALIADLESLPEAQWSTQSLCAAWTVREVLAHMTATAKMTTPGFLGKFIASGFRFNAMTASGVKAELGRSVSDTLAAFRSQLDATTHPPGPAAEVMAGDMVIHSQDIRWPLRIAHTFQPEMLTLVADFTIKSNALLGGKRRATGIKLVATDVPWVRGDGPEVQGPLGAIILALTGRKAGLTDLTGEGVSTLSERYN